MKAKMDDTDHVCPLCCEELDISDREFYPCKCGYQVCMWCWHRIRESESGLCPACRTPYGEDPHQFTALDVQEVLKQNKAAEAKKKPRHNSDSNVAEAPKDRSSLANMRVIRRNLVYVVGLPVSIASEETLRKPDYLGQYGKIAKIVINRSQISDANDPRRASASAYVTFQHKQDTLACILALDGFYLENRNIRASYGTSKYCSAFIKSVRCNNPECTYLHEIGADEDTFTKQEIQAGYVTSGRDVLARQQQILAEQLQQQQQQSTGGGTAPPRKRVGGGGPSGTGKASGHPVFPAPEFDEPSRPSATLVPPPGGVSRSSTTSHVAMPTGSKLGRAVSEGGAGRNTISTMAHQQRKSVASIVAGGRTVVKEESKGHLSLTSLTPLKKSVKAKPPAEDKLTSLRNGKRASVRKPPATAKSMSAISQIGGDVIGAPKVRSVGSSESVSSLGGEPITLNDSGSLGGEVFTGAVGGINSSGPTIIGGGGPSSVAAPPVNDAPVLQGGNSGLWNANASQSSGVIGSHISGGSSSELASILGINLPTGSGSLQESAPLWNQAPPQGPSALSALNNGALPTQSYQGPPKSQGSSLIGGVPIGGGAPIGGPPLGSGPAQTMGGDGKNSDIALLRSLLPGVHITSGGGNPGLGGNANGLGSAGIGGDVLIPHGGGWNGGNDRQQGWSMGGKPNEGPGIW